MNNNTDDRLHYRGHVADLNEYRRVYNIYKPSLTVHVRVDNCHTVLQDCWVDESHVTQRDQVGHEVLYDSFLDQLLLSLVSKCEASCWNLFGSDQPEKKLQLYITT